MSRVAGKRSGFIEDVRVGGLEAHQPHERCTAEVDNNVRETDQHQADEERLFEYEG